MPDDEATSSLSSALFGASEQRGISCSPALLLQAVLSFLSRLAETWKEKQSALCWVEGKEYSSKGIFFFFHFLNSILLENLEQCHFNFAKPHVGRETGSGRLVENAAIQLWLPRCAPSQHCDSSVLYRERQPCGVPCTRQPFQCPRCVGDTPSGWGQTFCS